jgi:hypothetical protein
MVNSFSSVQVGEIALNEIVKYPSIAMSYRSTDISTATSDQNFRLSRTSGRTTEKIVFRASRP